MVEETIQDTVKRKQYAARITYVPDMEGTCVFWSWQAEVYDVEKVAKQRLGIGYDKPEAASNHIALHSDSTWSNKETCKLNAKNVIENYLRALQEDNSEEVLFTL